MKKFTNTLLGSLFIGIVAFIAIGLSLTLSSCEKVPQPTKPTEDAPFALKEAFDSIAQFPGKESLSNISIDDIERGLSGAFPVSDCENWNFKRQTPDKVVYRVNEEILLGHILPRYGTDILPNSPFDFDNDLDVDITDVVGFCYFYNLEFEQVEAENVELVGGEISGSGLLANYPDPVFIDGDPVEVISLFEGSNCFLNETNADEDGGDCLNTSIIQFATDIGVVKFTVIN